MLLINLFILFRLRNVLPCSPVDGGDGCYQNVGAAGDLETKCVTACTAKGYVPDNVTGLCTMTCASHIAIDLCTADNCVVQENTPESGEIECGDDCADPIRYKAVGKVCVPRRCEEMGLSCLDLTGCVIPEEEPDGCADGCDLTLFNEVDRHCVAKTCGEVDVGHCRNKPGCVITEESTPVCSDACADPGLYVKDGLYLC
jgi:hypothetical protein